jgi:hypothetical protein
MVGAIAIAVATGCSSKRGDWEAARAVDTLRDKVATAIETWAARFDQLAKLPAGTERLESCADARLNLERLRSELDGFRRGATTLVRGWPDSIASSGLALRFGSEALGTLLLEVRCTTDDRPYPTYPKAVRDAGAKSIAQLDEAVASCRAHAH